MENVLIGPADYSVLFVPTVFFSFIILALGVSIFTYIIAIRIAPLLRAMPDFRFDHLSDRVKNVLVLWFIQYRQPRYIISGILHIFIFFGFIILGIRSFSLVVIGFDDNFVFLGFGGFLGSFYGILKDYASSLVLIACMVAGVRRGVFKPKRYNVPIKYGTDHTGEALFVLGMISVLMVSESFFEASLVAANFQSSSCLHVLAPFTLAWLLAKILAGVSAHSLQVIHIVAYYVHDITFFFFLCFLPMGKHFHVLTSLFNVFFMRTKKGQIKPVRYGVNEDQLDDIDQFGVKFLEDFTWKHILDFYTCADCGRCSENCPANAVGRPLSPRFISVKGRNLTYKNYPLLPYGGPFLKSEDLVGGIYSEDEIWSCTTCGACEEECPLGIEYIDKIVDLRRGMVDTGNVPQSLQKPFRALEKRGNPWGKMEKKRFDWTKSLPGEIDVKVLEKGLRADVLYFVDSITSYDDRIQEVARATAAILSISGIDFGILGRNEMDSGNEIRRFGEEMLFQSIRSMNTKSITKTNVKKIITSDPHSFNVLKNEYVGLPPVEHITQFVANSISSGRIKLKKIGCDADKIYTFHDPCYLGRHNNIYDSPRLAMDAIDGFNRIEMKRSLDCSFCCGGGGLMLFYEPKEDQRMGVVRVQMAFEAGANVIVTACPFCLVNIEDAIKVAGMEGVMEVIDFSELIFRQMS